MKNKRSSTGFVIGLTIITLIFLVLIELSKNTVIGWILTAAAVAGFVLVRRNLVSRDMYYRRPRKDMPEKGPDKTPTVSDDAGMPRKRALGPLCRLGFLAVLAAIYFISYPPIRQVPAVEGFGVEKTGIIKVAEGELTGVYNRDHTAEIYAGIPYAKAPVGELRWKEPQAPDRYDGVRACDTYGPMAVQSGNGPLFGSLYLIFGFHKYNFSLFDNYREKKSED
ncbi:MAG: carboxylesterase family protein, partial [Lachnospiraceae bacterium]|nr:carboxylesterase family protein [Lachnospiraceae bacterium]